METITETTAKPSTEPVKKELKKENKEEQLPLAPGLDLIGQTLPQETATHAMLSALDELKLKIVHDEFTLAVKNMNNRDWIILVNTLGVWLKKELTHRREVAIASKIKLAKFRKIQTIDNFDFKHAKGTEKIEKTYRALYNSISRENLPSAIFTGTAGLGKTHLARSLGYCACQLGLSVLFIPCAEMVNHLEHAQKTFTLETELNKYRRPQVLIIDELGYVSLNAQASNLFFQVISARHDANLGTIATTNLPFGKFNQIFANDAIAHAIVDRLVNTAEVFFIEGELSYREHERKIKTEKRKKQNA